MKKIILTVSFLFFSNMAFAGGVSDNNNGNKGDILIHTGENNGANSVGTWTDSSHFKGDKGDQGEKGDTGHNGNDGNDGVDGQDGVNGIDGKDGKDGEKGKKGDKGKEGQKGDKGEKGKGLKDAYEAQFEGVIYEDGKSATSIYYIRDFNNENNTVGVKFKYYFGKSHSEQVREDLQKQIDDLKNIQRENTNRFEEDNMEVIPTKTGFIMKRRF